MKFYDAVGYATSVETPPDSGVWIDVVTETKLFGDVLRNTRAMEEADKVNNDRSIGVRFSLIADANSVENFEAIRYVKWRGRRYLIRNIEYLAPRLIITPGGEYHGPTPEPAPTP